MFNNDKLDLKVISKVSEELGIEKHTLRYWESKFPQLTPVVRNRRRYYRQKDVDLLTLIRDLIQDKGYTLKRIHRLLENKDIANAKTIVQKSTTIFPDETTELKPSHTQSSSNLEESKSKESQTSEELFSIIIKKKKVAKLQETLNSTGLNLELKVNLAKKIKLDLKKQNSLNTLINRLKTLQNELEVKKI